MDQKQESTLSQKVKGSVVNQERQTGHLHFFPMNTLLQRSVCFHGQKSICNNVHLGKNGISGREVKYIEYLFPRKNIEFFQLKQFRIKMIMDDGGFFPRFEKIFLMGVAFPTRQHEFAPIKKIRSNQTHALVY